MTNQLLEPYACEKKSLVWFKKLGIHFIYQILPNSYLASWNQTNCKKHFTTYITQVCKALTSKHIAGAMAIIKKAEEQKIRRPQKMAQHDLVHAWKMLYLLHQVQKNRVAQLVFVQ